MEDVVGQWGDDVFARGTRMLLLLFHGALFGNHFEIPPKPVH